MTYFVKALKNNFYSKTHFLPKIISLQNQVIKTENHTILIILTIFLIHSTSSKSNFFITNPFSPKIAKSPQFNHNNTFINTQSINPTTTCTKSITTTNEHEFMHNLTPQLHFSTNLLKNTIYPYFYISTC
jgi:hypothetical protein